MRQIKFRFFNPPSKSFVENYSYNGLVEELFEQDDMLIPSQFTGMYDKNDKEIYEGDVVELVSTTKDKNKKGQIVYEGAAFFVKIIKPISTLYLSWLNHWLFDKEKIEVIGNVFENPEFIKD